VTPVRLDLPVRPSEAAELANLVFDLAERAPLTDDIRNRIAARASALRLDTIRPYFGSLERDPVHPSSYYLAIDGAAAEPLLLHMALATAPTSSLFPKPLLIGRMRRLRGPEMVINAIPFAPSDSEQIEKFCFRIDTAFLPRPQGPGPTITVSGDPPSQVQPAAFEAFRSVLKRTGKNLTSFGLATAPDAGLWSAIRAGWREGYNTSAELPLPGTSPDEISDAMKETIRRVAACSTFSIGANGLPGLEAWSDAAIEERFEKTFTADERGWIFDEFVRSFDGGNAVYELHSAQVLRLAVQFAHSLRQIDQLHVSIRQTRSSLKMNRSFDLELLLENASTATTPQQLIFCLHWFKQRGRPARLVAPCLEGARDLAEQLRTLSGIALHFQAKLSIRSVTSHTPEVLDAIARATLGRVNYRLCATPEVIGACIHRLAGHFVG